MCASRDTSSSFARLLLLLHPRLDEMLVRTTACVNARLIYRLFTNKHTHTHAARPHALADMRIWRALFIERP
ncbi:unnamed protein product [Mesocestoides corti]|uniref:Uncharacterized protein n=1 Tax=Mesocestoides corti TaxID=53468 RepID=A0A0R3UQI3_MESCO|nr:unnamed protein product [Mesocestoides corti]